DYYCQVWHRNSCFF
nr:immunoglobulin light chain junction region [Macaca mulatta]MOV97295.1 immunoglobulin light chain junction region [Macaca mulatta]MOV97367.1 immunoglobulin light chain junction region [Macaca mulatta]MOW00519.1 immunoglobulin light chain junction region [Macaca mulatta]